jgi:hypothetical protein
LLYGLVARNYLHSFDDVADSNIINFRKENSLNVYVPFHFFAGNPFDGRVQKKYPGKEFIYICVHRNFAKLNDFKIIPRHPASMEVFTTYNYLNGLEIIDWDKMDLRDYSDWDCKQICMAECLSPITITPDNFKCIFVRNAEIEERVKSACIQIFNDGPLFYINVNKHMFAS